VFPEHSLAKTLMPLTMITLEREVKFSFVREREEDMGARPRRGNQDKCEIY